jgi:hypothetical protein
MGSRRRGVRAAAAVVAIGSLLTTGAAAVAAAPLSATSGSGFIEAIDGRSSDDVWAVGFTSDSDGYYSLVRHWDGTTWTTIPSPDFEPYQTFLYGVAELSPTDVWAVGTTGSSSEDTVLIHWDGSAWTRFTSPNPYFMNSFSQINVVSADDIYVFGGGCPQGGAPAETPSGLREMATRADQRTSTGCGPVNVHWNGKKWANSSPALDPVEEVAGTSDDLWGVGFTQLKTGRPASSRAVIKHFDGTRWRAVLCPDICVKGAKLLSVDAFDPSDVWASGLAVAPGAPDDSRAIIAHFDGTGWTLATPPVGPGQLFALAGTSGNDLWALATSHARALTRIEHFNGQQWTTSHWRGEHDAGSSLTSLLSLARNDAWAAGGRQTTEPHYAYSQYLLHWDGTVWTEGQ